MTDVGSWMPPILAMGATFSGKTVTLTSSLLLPGGRMGHGCFMRVISSLILTEFVPGNGQHIGAAEFNGICPRRNTLSNLCQLWINE